MSVSRNCAVHRVTLSLRERERATSDRRTLMLISASNSKNEVNKFNVSAIVVREERRRGEETSKRQMPQKCCDERTTERTAIGSRMQMKIFTNENTVTVEFEKEEQGRREGGENCNVCPFFRSSSCYPPPPANFTPAHPAPTARGCADDCLRDGRCLASAARAHCK